MPAAAVRSEVVTIVVDPDMWAFCVCPWFCGKVSCVISGLVITRCGRESCLYPCATTSLAKCLFFKRAVILICIHNLPYSDSYFNIDWQLDML